MRAPGAKLRRRLLLLLVAIAVAVGVPSVGALAGPRAAADATPSDTTPPCPTSNPPDELTLGGGTPQTALLGTSFGIPLQVVLANSDGCPVTSAVGTPVSFTAPSSGASGSFATSGTNSVTVGADLSGNASAPVFAANDTAGSYTVIASSVYGSVSFSLTNSAAGIPATITPLSGTPQSAAVNSAYARQLSVRVLDGAGDPVSGATVTFTLGAGGGVASGGSSGGSSASASFANGSAQASTTTGSDGIATSPPFSANATIGRFTATAAVGNLPAPAQFQLENLPGKGERLTRLGPARLTATVEHRYRRRLRVLVRDAYGNPEIGTTVTFTLGGAGGVGSSGGTGGSGTGGGAGAGASFADGTSTATATTGLDGIADSPPLTANATIGRFTATAAVGNLPAPAQFQLENLPGKGERLTRLGPARLTATVEHRYRRRLRVLVRDAYGNPEIGTTVTFTLGGAGGVGSSGGTGGSGTGGGAGAGASFADGTSTATATTGLDGIATSPSIIAGGVAGTFNVTATTATTTGAVVFTLSNSAGEPAMITPGIAANEATQAGTRFAIALAVTVTDALGNKVAGALVTFTAPASGASGSFATDTHPRAVTVRTDSQGIAVAPAFTANAQPGGYVVIAAIGHGPRTAFALVNSPP